MNPNLAGFFLLNFAFPTLPWFDVGGLTTATS